MKLTAGQHGLEQVARVHGAFGLASAHNGMKLVDEEQNLTFALFDLGQHRLETLFKFATVLRASDQAAHIQAEYRAVFQGIRHVAAHNALGQSLGNGRFAHAGLTDQHRVILGLTGKNADNAANFVVTANYGVQLLIAGLRSQILAILGQRVIGFLRVLTADARIAAHALQGGQKALFVDRIPTPQVSHGARRLLQQTQEKVLNAQIFILHSLREVTRRDQCLFHIIGNIDFVGFPSAARHLGQASDHRLQAGSNLLRPLAHLGQKLRDQPLRVRKKRVSQMLLGNLLVLVFNG